MIKLLLALGAVYIVLGFLIAKTYIDYTPAGLIKKIFGFLFLLILWPVALCMEISSTKTHKSK